MDHPTPAHADSPQATAVRDHPALLTVIVPCFNEGEVIEQMHAALTEVLSAAGLAYELIYVDDCSRDDTRDKLRRIAQADPHARVITFSRNFGHQAAVTAGIDAAGGDVVVLIDADLQDPPQVIPQMLAKWREGYDVVYGHRISRAGESSFKQATAKWFYRLINRLSDTPIPLDTGDFRLMDRKVVEAMRRMPEHDRFLRGMVAWVGFRQTPLDYQRQPRHAGTSKYPLAKMMRFALDGIVSFSIVPLRLATFCGFVASCLAMLGCVYALVLRLFTGIWVPGWTLLFMAVLFMGGVQLITTGIIGEYVGRTYREGKRRPLYIIDEQIGQPRSGRST